MAAKKKKASGARKSASPRTGVVKKKPAARKASAGSTRQAAAGKAKLAVAGEKEGVVYSDVLRELRMRLASRR
jgi:hypothetical protein